MNSRDERRADFTKFWLGETISLVGAQVAVLALPLTVLTTFHGSSSETGLLNSLLFLPFTCSLFVGVWVDSIRLRPAMVGSNIVRAAVLLLLPLLATTGNLRLIHVYAAALLMGICAVVFDVSYWSYGPFVARSDGLVAANSRLEGSVGFAQVAGPPLAGLLVGFFTAPIALFANGISYLVSIASLLAISKREPKPVRAARNRSMRREIGDGLRFAFGNDLARACLLQGSTYNFCWLAQQTVFLPYATRRLGMAPETIGVIMGSGAVGAIVGAIVAQPIAAKCGTGRAIALATMVSGAAPLLLPIAGGRAAWPVAIMLTSFFLSGAGLTIANVHMVSLRQTITPTRLLARVNASFRFVSWGTMPIGGLLGGYLGDRIGLRAALLVVAAAGLTAPLWIVFSRVPRMRTLQELAPPQTTSSELMP